MKKIISLILASLFIGIVVIAPSSPAQAQVLSNRCCDYSGTIRCIMGAYGPLGTECFCFGQGTGVIC